MALLKKTYKSLLFLAAFLFIPFESAAIPIEDQEISSLNAQIIALETQLQREIANVAALKAQVQQQTATPAAVPPAQLYKRPSSGPRQYRRAQTSTRRQTTRGRNQPIRRSVQPRGRR